MQQSVLANEHNGRQQDSEQMKVSGHKHKQFKQVLCCFMSAAVTDTLDAETPSYGSF